MDNPASAEAMAEAERKLSRTADRQNKRFGLSLIHISNDDPRKEIL